MTTRTASSQGPGTALVLVLALLSAIAPFATDMYLPGFTDIAADFGTSATSVQLTLTTFLVGLAVGQLVIGPLSDRFGRKPPLVVCAVLCLLATALCAVAPSVTALVALRFVQGFTGSAGLVIGRAIVADLASGARAAQIFGLLMMIGGVAPVVAPLVGGVVVTSLGWRWVFWSLTVVTALMVAGVVLLVRESLPAQRRQSGGLGAMAGTARRLLADRRYLGLALAFALSFAVMFAYIAASPFVLEDVLGLSTTLYTVDFAVNAVALVAMSALSGVLVGRVSSVRLLSTGVATLTGASVLLLVDVVVLGTSPWPTLVLLAVAVGSLGLVLPNATALASERARAAAGTGSALLGALQFGLAAVVSPLVGLGGTSALPMALVMTATALGAVACLVLAAPWSTDRSVVPTGVLQGSTAGSLFDPCRIVSNSLRSSDAGHPAPTPSSS